MAHNIEKSGFRRGEYVGYGSGRVWKITRFNNGWRAYTQDSPYEERRASTLEGLSPLIEKARQSNPRSRLGTKKHAARVAAMLADQAKGIRYYGFKAQTDMQGDSATSSEAKRLFREASHHFAGGNYAEGMKAWKAADKAEKSNARQSNPRSRLGTKKPRRASTATGRAPTKRLVARRKANVKKGYFPNPGEIRSAHAKSPAPRGMPSKGYYILQLRQSAERTGEGLEYGLDAVTPVSWRIWRTTRVLPGYTFKLPESLYSKPEFIEWAQKNSSPGFPLFGSLKQVQAMVKAML